ncbi:hypothetical protein HK097_004781 [Rhizophlyctis rosea]|uniref:Uncharacterized protein n=1 Tax=Rhizophlyctis rosea TaxID=64517 RepID=A0AAD5S8F8_9FUNG|nr:hypothetical protein HK097_004781 [Rhizophlyctis rosea]
MGVGSVLGNKEKGKDLETGQNTGSVLGKLTALRSNIVNEIHVEMNSIKVPRGDCMSVPILSNHGTKGSEDGMEEMHQYPNSDPKPTYLGRLAAQQQQHYNVVPHSVDRQYRRHSGLPEIVPEAGEHWEDTIFSQYGSPANAKPQFSPPRSSVNLLQQVQQHQQTPRSSVNLFQQQQQQYQPQSEKALAKVEDIASARPVGRPRRRTHSQVDTPDEQWQKMRWIKLFVNSKTVATGISGSGGTSN